MNSKFKWMGAFVALSMMAGGATAQQQQQQERPGQNRANDPSIRQLQPAQGNQESRQDRNQAQPRQQRPGSASDRFQQQNASQSSEENKTFAAHELVGMKVQNDQGQTLGEIEGVALDKTGKKVAYLGMIPEKQPGQAQPGQVRPGQAQQGRVQQDQEMKIVAIPHKEVTFSAEKNALIVDATPQDVQKAKGFSPDSWPKQPETAWLQASGSSDDQLQGRAEFRSRAENRSELESSVERSSREQAEARRQAQQRDQRLGQRPGSEQNRDAARTTREGDVRLRLNEEQLNVDVEEVEAGGVVVRTTVDTRQVSRPVELEREHVEIKRLDPQQASSQVSDNAFKEQEIFIPLSRERAVVSKDVNVREVVELDKQTETEQQTVEAQLRREQLDINRRGEAAQGGTRSQVQGAGDSQTQLRQNITRELTASEDGKKALLTREEMQRINIRVNQQQVTLQGSVKSEQVKQQILQRVRDIEGVENVNDQLQVNANPENQGQPQRPNRNQ